MNASRMEPAGAEAQISAPFGRLRRVLIGPGARRAFARGCDRPCAGPRTLRAQDCLTCHGDASMTDSAGTQHRRRRQEIRRQHSRQPAMHELPRGHQGLSASRQDCAGGLQDLPRRPGGSAQGQRARRQQGASVHELPRQRARNLSQDRRALGGLSAQRAQDLRPVPRQQRHGGQARIGQRLPELHRFDPRVCAEQRGAAGGGQLPKLPRLAPHPEPHQSAEPDVQVQHPEDLRQLPRQDQRRLPGRRPRHRPSPGAI